MPNSAHLSAPISLETILLLLVGATLNPHLWHASASQPRIFLDNRSRGQRNRPCHPGPWALEGAATKTTAAPFSHQRMFRAPEAPPSEIPVGLGAQFKRHSVRYGLG